MNIFEKLLLILESHEYQVGDIIDWREFKRYLMSIQLNDSFGKLSDSEKAHIAAASEQWKLGFIDVNSLKETDIISNTKYPIIIQDNDVLDGTRRLLKARLNREQSIKAWIAI